MYRWLQFDLAGLKQATLSLFCFLSKESDSSNVPVTRQLWNPPETTKVANPGTGTHTCVPSRSLHPELVSLIILKQSLWSVGVSLSNHWQCPERRKGPHGKAHSFASAPAPEFQEPQWVAEQFDLQALLQIVIKIKWAMAVRGNAHHH